MLSFAMLAQGGVFEAVLQSFPTDPAAIFTLGLFAVATAAVFVGGRKKKGPGPGGHT